MNYNSGNFKCPKCGNNKVNSFKNWLSRDEFIENNTLKTKWIFYQDEKKEWKCCKCCNNDWGYHCGNTLICCCIDDSCNGCVLFYPCISIFYILFYFWCDLIYFLCMATKDYFGVSGKVTEEKISGKNKDNVWNDIGGLTEEEWNSKYKKKWECSNCKYCTDSFLDFLPNSKPNVTLSNNNYESEILVIKGNPIQPNSVEDIIAINFVSGDQSLHFCIPCNKNDKFSFALDKLYKEYPECRKKKCYYLANGNIIVPNKTLAENKIKSGNTIIINFEE
jgi:hypothetical protein